MYSTTYSLAVPNIDLRQYIDDCASFLLKGSQREGRLSWSDLAAGAAVSKCKFPTSRRIGDTILLAMDQSPYRDKSLPSDQSKSSD